MDKILGIHKNRTLRFFRILLTLTIIEGLYSIYIVTRLPSESGSIIFIGLSIKRILLIGVLTSLNLYLIFVLYNSKKLSESIRIFFERKAIRILLLVLGLFLFWLGFITGHDFDDYSRFYVRLKPLILHLCFILLNIKIYIFFSKIILKKEQIKININFSKFVSSKFIVFFIPLLSFLIFLEITKIGINARDDYWGEAGSVLFGYQLVASLLIAIISGLVYSCFLHDHIKGKNLDYAIFFLLWIVAAFLWINHDIPHNFFSPETSILGAERYPFSDAAGYDVLANSILIGKAFSNTAFTSRPVFIFYLSILHFFSNSSYSSILFLQGIILSLSVPLIFLIGKLLHSRFAGLLVAIIYCVLELNSIGSSKYVQVSNSKLLLTEPLTGLLIIFLTYLLLKGLKEHNKHKYIYLSAGILGLSFLVRLHTAVLLGPIIAILFIFALRNKENWFKNISYYLIIVAIVVLPWMFRNYLVVGNFSPDPNRFNLLLNNRWGENLNEPRNNAGKNQRITNSDVLSNSVVETETYFTTTVEHFFHNEALSFLSLPLSYNYQTVDKYYQETFKLWKDWSGNLSFQEKLLLFVNIIIFSIGISSAWVRLKFLGMMPMLFQVSYHVANAIVRTSGWRYLKPVDWVVFLYFAIGVIEIFNYLSKGLIGIDLGSNIDSSSFAIQAPLETKTEQVRMFIFSNIFFLSLSIIISFSPALIPDRYKVQDEIYYQDEVLELLPEKLGITEDELFSEFLNNDKAFYEVGKLLYPRYFMSKGLSYKPSIPFYGLDFPRYEFVLLNDRKHFVYLPLDIYEKINNGGDVIIVGCKDNGNINALAIIFLNEENKVFTRSPLINLKCP